MKFKIKIWHLLLLILLSIWVFRFNAIVDSIKLLLYNFKFLFARYNFFVSQLTFNLFDTLISVLLLILLPVLVFSLKKRIKSLSHSVTFATLLLAIFLSFSVFAPIISTVQPNKQFTLSVAKLLPPLSSKKIVEIYPVGAKLNDEENYLQLKKKIFGEVVDENTIIADSVKTVGADIVVLKNNFSEKINIDNLKRENKRFEKYSLTFLLGTDEFGRDIFSRLISGTRLSFFIGLCAVIISLLIGLSLGFISGYYGGAAGSVFNRFTDMLLAFPLIFLIILFIALFGNSAAVIIFVLGISGWMSLYKIVRGEVIVIKNKDFVITSEMLGISKGKIFIKDILPNIIPSVVVNSIFLFGNVIIAEAALSFLGLGLGNTYPSWGAMIETGQSYLSSAWWVSFFPCLFLFFTLYMANNFGRKLEKIYNPAVE